MDKSPESFALYSTQGVGPTFKDDTVFSGQQSPPFISNSIHTYESGNHISTEPKDNAKVQERSVENFVSDSDDDDEGEAEAEDQVLDQFELLQKFMQEPMNVKQLDNKKNSFFDTILNTKKFEVVGEVQDQQVEFNAKSKVSSFAAETQIGGSSKELARYQEMINHASESTDVTSGSSRSDTTEEEPSQKRSAPQPLQDVEKHKKLRVDENKENCIPTEITQENQPNQPVASDQVNVGAIQPKTQSDFKFCYHPLWCYSFDFMAGFMSKTLSQQMCSFDLNFQDQSSMLMSQLPIAAQEIQRLKAIPPAFISMFSPAELLEPKGLAGLFQAFAKIEKAFKIDFSILNVLKQQHIQKGSLKLFAENWEKKHIDIKKEVGNQRVVDCQEVGEKQFGAIIIIVLTIAQQVLQINCRSKEVLKDSHLFMEFFKKIGCNDKNRTFLLTIDCREHVYNCIHKTLLKATNKMRSLLKFEGEQNAEERLQLDALGETLRVIKESQSLESFSQLMIAMKTENT